MLDMSEIKIERIPVDTMPSGNRKYPFRELRPGDSFYIAKGPDGQAHIRAKTAARWFRAKTGWLITWRNDDGGTRIARHSDDSDEAAARRLRAAAAKREAAGVVRAKRKRSAR